MTERNNSAPSANTPTRRQIIFGAAAAFGGLVLGSANARADSADEISHTAESIHMEPVFKAGPSRVYQALTVTAQFDKVSKLSAAMQSGMAPATKPTIISPVAGGAFSLFGGYVTGRNIELVPNKRIVQAWRPMTWTPGTYSIAKFELTEQDSGTKIIFDHTGFPQGTGEHLAEGWHENYWNPLVLFLATAP
ncbi:MAG: SRPBCC family protein [Candidatus Acidiferrales bacterium]